MLRLLRLASFIPGVNALAAPLSIASSVVSFFCTPVGKWVAIGLVGLGLYLAGDIHRARVDRAEWTAAAKAHEAERAARDEEIRKQVSADAARRVADIQQQTDALAKQVTDYETALAARPSDNCRISPDDLKRLRRL